MVMGKSIEAEQNQQKIIIRKSVQIAQSTDSVVGSAGSSRDVQRVGKELDQKREKIDWTPLLERLPDTVWRSRWNELANKYGLPYSRSYLQNLDSEGKGPPKYYLNKRVAYKKTHLIQWLNSL